MGHLKSIALLPLLALTAQAASFPRQIVNGFTGTSQICGVTYDDPARDWANTGASVFLDKYLKDNGDVNWANKIDQSTTNRGSQGISNLDCVDFLGGNCPFPSVQCKDFTPPALFHVRVAMATCHRMFEALHEGLQDNTISQQLKTPQLIVDFGEPPAKTSNLPAILSSAFGIGAGITAAAHEISGPLAVVGALFSLAAASQPPEAPDFLPTLDSELQNAFNQTNGQIKDIVKTIFGGGSATANLPGLSSPNGETQNIAKFFSGGRFLVKVTSDGAIDSLLAPAIDKGYLFLKQALVVVILKAQNYYVFVDTSRTESDCNKITGSRFIDNQCFTIESFQRDNNFREDGSIAPRTRPIDPSIVGKLDNSEYQIDGKSLPKPRTAHPGFDGKVDSSAIPLDGSIPPCFFSLPVIKAETSPCEALNAGIKLPSNLGFDEKSCGAGSPRGPGVKDPHNIGK
ncbi:MAG: hypothetical protein M1814_000654 [Vezdaea aestivalis]|nr:MAG: hypothetical protein M1814_000654 [Vezdaea aestivalis]